MTSAQLQADVQHELEWDPALDASHVAVSGHDGSVTLSGYVSSYFEKSHAVAAAEQVRGVKAVADEIEVHLHQASTRKDSEIAEGVAGLLQWSGMLKDQAVQATVSDGHVILTGEVAWNYQRQWAERTVGHVVGVTFVSNQISLRPHVAVAEVEKKIMSALARRAALDARQIHVTVSGTRATLSGQVHSYDEVRVAKDAAWSAPGVSDVDAQLLEIHP